MNDQLLKEFKNMIEEIMIREGKAKGGEGQLRG